MFNNLHVLFEVNSNKLYNGIYNLDICFQNNFKSPIVTFHTKIYHPNLNNCGQINESLISDIWNTKKEITYLIEMIKDVIENPN